MPIEKINYEECNGCGICVNICPMDVLRMDEEGKKAVIQYPEDCMVCEFCVFECPEDAISIAPGKSLPLIVSWG